MVNKPQISDLKYLTIILVITVAAAAGCAKKDSVAHAAETGGTVGAAGVSENVARVTDQVKHRVTSFDLEGIADDGSKKWDVKGQSAESVTEDKVKLNKVTAGSYGKDAQATITADAGVYDKANNNVRLEQNVKAVIENTGKSAGDFVGMSNASPTDKSKKTTTIITCDAEVEFNYAKNEGYFNKNVHVINDEGSIDSDRLTVYLDPASKTIMTIVAEGNVKIKRGENMTYSDKATYIAADKKIVLTGQPRLVIYQEGDGQVLPSIGTLKK
jgi:hypothetical protein